MADFLKSEHHIVKYVGLDKMNDNQPSDGAFMEVDWSSNWLEYYGPPKTKQVNSARSEMSGRLKLGKRGSLVELNVGTAIGKVLSETGEQICVERDPLPEHDSTPSSPSHCEARGMPPDDTQRQCEVAAVLAESYLEVHPAVVPPPAPAVQDSI